MNAPIQGTAADIMKIAMIRVFERMEKEQLKSKMILQVHDELIIETAVDETEQVEKLLQKCMTDAAELKTSLLAETGKGNNWYEAH